MSEVAGSLMAGGGAFPRMSLLAGGGRDRLWESAPLSLDSLV